MAEICGDDCLILVENQIGFRRFEKSSINCVWEMNRRNELYIHTLIYILVTKGFYWEKEKLRIKGFVLERIRCFIISNQLVNYLEKMEGQEI